jgi:hypothetical protein
MCVCACVCVCVRVHVCVCVRMWVGYVCRGEDVAASDLHVGRRAGSIACLCCASLLSASHCIKRQLSRQLSRSLSLLFISLSFSFFLSISLSHTHIPSASGGDHAAARGRSPKVRNRKANENIVLVSRSSASFFCSCVSLCVCVCVCVCFLSLALHACGRETLLCRFKGDHASFFDANTIIQAMRTLPLVRLAVPATCYLSLFLSLPILTCYVLSFLVHSFTDTVILLCSFFLSFFLSFFPFLSERDSSAAEPDTDAHAAVSFQCIGIRSRWRRGRWQPLALLHRCWLTVL